VACMDDLPEGVSPETLFNPPAPAAPPPPIILGLSTPPGSISLDPNTTDAYAQTTKGLRERAGIGSVAQPYPYLGEPRGMAVTATEAQLTALLTAYAGQALRTSAEQKNSRGERQLCSCRSLL